MSVDGGSKVVVQFDLGGRDLEGTLTGVAYAISDEELRLSMGKLVQRAERTENGSFNALSEEFSDFVRCFSVSVAKTSR